MKFTELSEEAKETAIENFRDINLHDDWDTDIIENETEQLEEIGLSNVHIRYLQGESCTFSADISDIPKFLKEIGVDSGLRFPKGEYSNEVEDDGFFQQIDSWKSDKCDDIFRALEEEYEFQTSDEQVEETIIANGYDFNEYGMLKNE